MSERVALVTGASGSLGREVVRVLGTAGWRVLGQVHRSSAAFRRTLRCGATFRAETFRLVERFNNSPDG